MKIVYGYTLCQGLMNYLCRSYIDMNTHLAAIAHSRSGHMGEGGVSMLIGYNTNTRGGH